MTDEPAVLGIDLGTSQVKALLCTRDGRVLGQGIAEYPLLTPRVGWAETDPAQWWRATCAAVRAAMVSHGGEIGGLAIVGQMHGLVLTDARGTALRPAIVWLDRRSTAEVDDYLRLPRRLRSALGNWPSPGMAGPTAAWLARHEPQTFRQARWLLQPKDWLRMRLTGEAASDPTDASGTLLFDMARGQWATETAEAMGLSVNLLPPLRPSSEIAGRLRSDAAAQLGLHPGLPVAIGAADTAASVLAAATPGPGWGLLTLGTGGQWTVPVTETDPVADPNGQANLFRKADGGVYRLAAVQNVGVALAWVTSTLGASWADLYGTAACPWRPDTPAFLPYLAGERWDQAAADRGAAWSGLSLAHRREDMLRAALEGVAFLLRSKLDDLHRAGCRPEQVVIAGGGSRHADWRRLLSDVFQLPLFSASSPWLSVRGAALIAGVATGLYSGWAEAAGSVAPPEPAAGTVPCALAQQRYQRWRNS
jgi:xylulokinase